MGIGRALLKQSKPKLWLGGLRDMIQRTQAYYAMINAGLLLITTYTVREATIHEYAPWMTWPVILGIIALMMLTILIVDYKWVYPSQIAFHQHEAFKHRSMIRQQLDGIEKKVDILLGVKNGK